MYQQGNDPTVIVEAPPEAIYPINEKSVKYISITIVVLGCCCIILQIIGMTMGVGLSETAAGIWSGVGVSVQNVMEERALNILMNVINLITKI